MKKSTLRLALVAAGAMTLTACGGGEGFEDNGGEGGAVSPDPGGNAGGSLVMLIGSSGQAETTAVQDATAAWTEESGVEVEVRPATDLGQELAQGFAGGNPPDIFYLDASQVAEQASAGNLYAYEAEDNDDFFPALREAFTYDEQQWCAPKDFSTLALQINTAAWEESGLTDDDIPTSYEELATVAETLTEGNRVGLVLGPGIDRLGTFVVGHGGWWVNDEGTEPTGTSEEVIAGLEYVKENMAAGSFAYASSVDAGWGGEAFGTERAAMTMEGNWIRGAMENDYPDVDYTVVEIPEGPAGPGTLLFSNCWGIAAESGSQEQAVDLVNFLTAPEQQLAFAEAFGVMPSRQSATGDYTDAFPEDAPFIAGGEYGRGPINAPGMSQVVADLNSQLENLGGANVQQVMESFDQNASAVLEQ